MDLTEGAHFERELLLLKLKAKPSQLQALQELVAATMGHVLSNESHSFVIELTSSEAQVSRFLAQVAEYAEILEVVRSGALGIAH